MKLLVKVRDVKFWTNVEDEASILDLKFAIEKNYSSLNLSAPPLRVNLVMDRESILLPESCTVREVLRDGDLVGKIALKLG